ncbi:MULTISPECIES: hypothetical protein [Psychrobacter]|nr:MULTISPECIES: hypothetical protein [Psychrobacter]
MATLNFQKEFSSKIPALTLLTTLGYEFGSKQSLTGEKLFMVGEE